jgi:hypothetical protein
MTIAPGTFITLAYGADPVQVEASIVENSYLNGGAAGPSVAVTREPMDIACDLAVVDISTASRFRG